ncbi:hypothetical protein Tco_1488196, partial [Tanacetum coccineum]
DRRQALKEKVFNWLKEGIIKKVQHPEWITNATLIKLESGAWIPYRRRSIPFHSHAKRAKNSAATLQRMVEKVLADQKGRNVEVYLEEIVVKSKDEQSLIEDVQETLNKLKWVNMKINPNESTFGMKEGRKLASIDRFIPKLAELMIPIRKVRRAQNDERGQRSLPEDKKKVAKIANTNHAKGRRSVDTLLTTKEGDNQLYVTSGKKGKGTPATYVERKKGKGTQTKQRTPSRTNPNAKGMEVILKLRSRQRRFGHGMDYEALLAGLVASADKGSGSRIFPKFELQSRSTNRGGKQRQREKSNKQGTNEKAKLQLGN